MAQFYTEELFVPTCRPPSQPPMGRSWNRQNRRLSARTRHGIIPDGHDHVVRSATGREDKRKLVASRSRITTKNSDRLGGRRCLSGLESVRQYWRDARKPQAVHVGLQMP